MENKKRLSFEDSSSSSPSSSSSSSALRRLTRSPTGHRLSLRRSSTTSSSATSVTSSIDDEATASCVSRNTSNDECALYRFIVWAAVKRNACQRMTPEERRECPMLRCRKRFPNHELMLQHLYACEHLAGGEYWCYDCEKAEQLNDAKCKRCLGHPSRRRRIMSIAKNLFSSLGHKPKHQNFASISSSLDVEDVPPSYESVFIPPPQPEGEYELSSTEIHEIGSSEVQLPPILEDESEMEPDSFTPGPRISNLPIPSSSYPLALGTEQNRMTPSAGLEADLINWEPSPSPKSTIAPQALMKLSLGRQTDRPSLQVHTHGLDQLRRQNKRSKALAPSSSVRSTSSTDSNESSISTASYSISPMSGWSGGWAKASGFDSALTSPEDDLVSPHSFLPVDTMAASCRPMPFSNSELDNVVANSCPSELPADIPMFDLLSMNHESMNLDQSAYSFNTSLPVQVAMEPSISLPQSIDLPPPPPPPPQTELVAQLTGGSLTDSMSLIGSAQETLEMHIADSMTKLDDINQNHLVAQFRRMTPASIATTGLETIIHVLEGRQSTSPVNLICFIHVIFSLSLVVHEQDTSARCASLFKQALRYSSWFSNPDRGPFIEVVYSLWKPNEVSDDEIINLLKAASPGDAAISATAEGKRPADPLQELSSDPLIFLAQYFLDELEYSALRDNTHPKVQASDLAIQHIRDSLTAANDSPFTIAAKFMIQNVFSRQYSYVPGFALSMKRLVDQIDMCEVATIRRLELELMQAGKMNLSSDCFYNKFIKSVRRQTNSLYGQGGYFNPRSTYHHQAIQLMISVINESNDHHRMAPTSVQEEGTPKSVDAIHTNFDTFDFDSVINFDQEQNMHTDITEPSIALGAALPLATAGWDTAPPMDGSELLTGQGSSGMATPATQAPDHATSSSSAASTETESSASPNSKLTTPDKADLSASAKVVQADSGCKLCAYRPKGDPRWFVGSMAKHMRTIHSDNPQIFRCPYPGCTSQYSKRADNLRQHQIEKGHFVDGQELQSRRPRKRRRTVENA